MAATYYLANAGSDSNAGTLAASPWQTIAKANTAHRAGDTLLFNRGDKWREQLEVTHSDVTVGAYGATPVVDTNVSGLIHTNAPIISGSNIVTGYTLYNPPTSASELLTNANLDTWTNSITPTSWVPSNDAPVEVIAEESTTVRSGKSCKLSDDGTGFSAFLYQDVASVAALTDYVFQFYHQDPATLHCSYSIQIIGGALANQFLQSDGSWSATGGTVVANKATNSPGAFGLVSRQFTTPNPGGTMTLRVKIQGLDPLGPYYIDDASLKLATAASVNANTYRAQSLAQNLVASKNDVTLFMGASETTLADQQFFWKAGWFYIRNSAGNPDTNSDVVEGGTRLHCIDGDQIHRTNVSYVTCEKSNGRGINFTSIVAAPAQAPSVTHCWLRQVGFEGTNPITLQDTGETGAVSYSNVDDGVIEFNRFEDCHTDEVFGFNTRRISIQSNYHATTFDFFADNIQLAARLDHLSDANFTIKHNRCTQILTNSDKGNITVVGDNGVIAFNTCSYGNYGVSGHGNNLLVEFNTCYYHGLSGGANGTDDFGAGLFIGIGLESDPNAVYDGMVWRYNTVISPLHGMAIYGTVLKSNLSVYHNTIHHSTGWGFKSETAPLSGIFKNNIVWAPDSSLGVYKVGASSPGWASDYNLLGPAGTGWYFWNGTAYNTLAAYHAASGNEAHSIASDPLFVGPQEAGLQVTSPAIDAGVVIPGSGQVIFGAAPDMGSLESGNVPHFQIRESIEKTLSVFAA